jgi:hypothetical protein
MLSEVTIRYLIRIFVYAAKLCLTPYEWNVGTIRLGWSFSIKRQIFCFLVTLYNTGDCVYLTITFLRMLLSPGVPFELLMEFSSHWFTRLAPLMDLYSILIKNEDYSHFYNALIELDRKLQGNSMLLYSLMYCMDLFAGKVSRPILNCAQY